MTAPTFDETVLDIACGGQFVTGILTRPALPRAVGVVIVVGGPQYRAGSHRQFVQLARSLATAGYTALRFDVRGMGDSGGVLLNFEQLDNDIDAAVAALLAVEPGIQGVVLWGLCDGASAALLHAHSRANPHVTGLCLVNPWVRSDEGLARTQLKHYYLQRLLQGSFWRKLLRGKIASRALQELWQSVSLARRSASNAPAAAKLCYQDRMADGLSRFTGPVLVLLSSHDYTAKEFVDHTARFPTWQQAMNRANVEQKPLEGADHTCSNPGAQSNLEQFTVQWLGRSLGGAMQT